MTTDADAYQRLTTALDAHRGDAEAYRRLGAQMTARRHLLGPLYGNRRLFVRERLVPLGLKETAAYKLVYDVERGELQGRAGFSAGNMLMLAQAYGLTPDEIIAVLGGGEFESHPGPPALIRDEDIDFSGGDRESLEPYIAELLAMALEAGRSLALYGDSEMPDPADPGDWDLLLAVPGRFIFPDNERHAGIWDNRKLRAGERLTLLAQFRRNRDPGTRRESRRTGLTSARPSLAAVAGTAYSASS